MHSMHGYKRKHNHVSRYPNQPEQETQLMLTGQNLDKQGLSGKSYDIIGCAHKIYTSVLRHCANTKSPVTEQNMYRGQRRLPNAHPHITNASHTNQNMMAY